MNMLEPRLGIPGQKPTGPVEIDWSHPLSKGLKHVYLNRGGNNHIEDVVKGTNVYTPYEAQHLEQVAADEIGQCTAITANNCALEVETIGAMPSGSAILHYKRDGVISSGDRYVFAHSGWETGNRLYLGTNQNAEFVVRLGESAVHDSNISTPNNAISTVGVTWSGGTARIFGKDEGLDSITYTYTGTPGSDSDWTCFGYHYSTSNTASLLGAAGSVILYDRQISDEEMISLLADVYQFLKPAGQRLKTPALAITTPPTANIAGVRVPDPKWEEPGLLVPGQKPAGPVTIDWDNPLTQHLMFFVVPGISDVDLVTGRVPTAKVGTWSYVDGGVKFPTSSYWEYGVYPDIGFGSGSAMMMADLDATEGNAFALSYAQSSSGARYISLTKATDGNITFSFRCDENSVFSASANPGTNKGVFVGMAGAAIESDGAIRARVYYQNEQIAYRLIAASDNWVATQDRMTIGASRDSSPGYSTGGVVKMVAMFYQPLSYEGCKSLSMDPYQFLIPA